MRNRSMTGALIAGAGIVRAGGVVPRHLRGGRARGFRDAPRFQRRGVGRAALLLVIEHVRSQGRFEVLTLSYVPGPGCPEPFYLGLGFRHTGRLDGNEIVLELPLR